MSVWRSWSLAVAVGVLLCGCYSTDFYKDPEKIGSVPVGSQKCGVGCVGNGARWSTGVQAHQEGIFILVAGDQPLMVQAVEPNDTVVVYVDHPLVGNCHVQLLVNNVVKQRTECYLAVYRGYFSAAG